MENVYYASSSLVFFIQRPNIIKYFQNYGNLLK